MFNFSPIDAASRIAAAGSAASTRSTAAEGFHARIDEFRRRSEDSDEDAGERDTYEHSAADDGPGTQLPTAASPIRGDSVAPAGYRPDGSLPQRGIVTGGSDPHVDFVA